MTATDQTARHQHVEGFIYLGDVAFSSGWQTHPARAVAEAVMLAMEGKR